MFDDSDSAGDNISIISDEVHELPNEEYNLSKTMPH